MARRPACANCTRPFTPGTIGKTRVVTSFCTVSCGAEFAERVLRSEPAVASLLIANDPLAERLQLATGCGKYVWDERPNNDRSRWVVCTGGKGCKQHHPGHPNDTQPTPAMLNPVPLSRV